MNDVLSDLRAILSSSGLSDSEIETGFLPALTKHNADQFTVVETEGGKALVTPASRVGAEEVDGQAEERHVEPRGGNEFVFDHLKGVSRKHGTWLGGPSEASEACQPGMFSHSLRSFLAGRLVRLASHLTL